MTINNLPIATLAYIEATMLPQIPSTLKRWLTYAGAVAKVSSMNNIIAQHSDMLSETGVINDAGEIDLVKAKEIGNAAFEKVPKIDIAEFTFDRNDFEAFISFLSTQG